MYGEPMLNKRIVIGVAVIVLVASIGMAMSSRLALVRARHQGDIQDALIASLQSELAAVRSGRGASAPAPISFASRDLGAEALSSVSKEALLDELDAAEQEVMRLSARVEALEAAQEAQASQQPQGRAERMQAWRERMQQQDPEGYERRREEGREMMGRVAETTRDRLLFMQSIPTEGLAPEYLENHHALLERLEFFDRTMQEVAANPDDPQNRARLPQMFAQMRGLDEMLQMQRDVLLDDFARDIGYQGEDAETFVSAIHVITDMTTIPGPGYLRRAMRGDGRGATQQE